MSETVWTYVCTTAELLPGEMQVAFDEATGVQIVVFNLDGDLYAYGEALGGVLPEINERLAKAGSAKRYHNLIGYTFGTGLGIGTVINGELNRGDNSCVETFCLKHPDMPDIIVEDVDLRSKLGHNLSVDGHDTGLDEVVSLAA